MPSVIHLAQALALALPLTLAAPSAETTVACSEITKALPGKVSLPDTSAYTKENKDYYNGGLAELKPACISFPESAEEVSAIVKILNKHSTVPYAVKSGGHDPNPGHSSINDGVLIALRKIAGVELDKEKEIAYLKPGGHWWDVIPKLEKDGYTIVSGRLGVVGIGGYMMQGGLSFLSGQYGMAADNIVEWELVTANGSITTVNAKRQPALARAMRGGGSQFGIATKFTVKAYKLGQAWGGIRLYTGDRDKVLAALHDFIPRMNKDPKAAIIVTGGMALPELSLSSLGSMLGLGGASKAPAKSPAKGKAKGSAKGAAKGLTKGSAKGASRMTAAELTEALGAEKGWDASGNNFPEADIMALMAGSPLAAMTNNGLQKGLGKRSGAEIALSGLNSSAATGQSEAFGIFFSYDGPTPPKGAYGLFEDITPTYDTCKTKKYSDIVSLTDSIWALFNQRASFRSITLPYRADKPDWYAHIEDLWTKIQAKYGASAGSTIAFQPFPAAVGKASEARGGNAMGLSGADHDRFILEIAGIYTKGSEDQKVHDMSKELTDTLAKELAEAQAAESSIGTYNPLFMNDANYDQDVFSTYKDYQTFAKMQRQLDPRGFFAKRAGGFKIKANV